MYMYMYSNALLCSHLIVGRWLLQLPLQGFIQRGGRRMSPPPPPQNLKLCCHNFLITMILVPIYKFNLRAAIFFKNSLGGACPHSPLNEHAYTLPISHVAIYYLQKKKKIPPPAKKILYETLHFLRGGS